MFRATFLTAVIVVASSIAAAQAPKPSGSAKGRDPVHQKWFTFFSPFDLLKYSSVREELNMTPAQEARMKEIQQKRDRFNEESQKAFKELGDDPSRELRRAFLEHERPSRQAMEEETDGAMLKSLDAKQRTRLDQIGLQREGPDAFRSPAIQELLNMDPGQIELVTAIVDQGLQEARQVGDVPPEVRKKALIHQAGTNFSKIDPRYAEEYEAAKQKARKAVQDARNSTQRQIARLLTRKQRQTYQSLCGEPFDLSLLRLHPPQAKKEAKAK
jgi:hypothetical protein